MHTSNSSNRAWKAYVRYTYAIFTLRARPGAQGCWMGRPNGVDYALSERWNKCHWNYMVPLCLLPIRLIFIYSNPVQKVIMSSIRNWPREDKSPPKSCIIERAHPTFWATSIKNRKKKDYSNPNFKCSILTIFITQQQMSNPKYNRPNITETKIYGISEILDMRPLYTPVVKNIVRIQAEASIL